VSVPHVLSVEDSDADFSMLVMALHQCLDTLEIDRARDGEEAVTALSKSGISRPRPDLVLLDVNLPRINGLEVLEFIRSQPFIRDVPVVMFTTSSAIQDQKRAMALGATEFVTKPSNLDRLMEVIAPTLSEVN
jgi:chemotaxis family two-component system response regulator Rcp1